MRARLFLIGCAAVLIAVCGARMDPVRAQGPDLGTDAQRQAGQQHYQKYCAQCHGDKGDGNGYATPNLLPKPRDFTTGKYKVRSTPTGALPTHQDLVSIIRRGMPYTSMPAWPDLTDQQVSELAYYIKSFSPDFANPEAVPKPVPLPSAPGMTDASVQAGKKLYEETGCIRCHGNLGRGDGPSGPTLVDDLRHPIRPADLSQSWTFRGGSTREDIFRTMSTGFNGTPMPGFVDALSEEQRWAITDYIVSLSGTDGPRYTNLVIAKHVLDPIDLTKGAANFQTAAVARFPLVGQIMEPGRAFHPPATSVAVQAIYDTESIAILVRWNDMMVDKTGKAGPSLPAPEQETAPAAAAAAAPAPDDPFADPAAAPTTVTPSEFNDAVAIQIPSAVPSGARKPYFIFGDGQNSVDLWFFDLGRTEPQQFTGRGSADITANDTGDLTGVASYDQGEWSVIYKRPLRPAGGAGFAPGEFLPISFSVWDGFSRERGNRRALSVWYSLYVEPENVPSAVGPMIRTALILFFIELAVIGWVRWRYGSRSRTARDGEQSAAVTSV
jgi:mono/diheme cytochrome c family protein